MMTVFKSNVHNGVLLASRHVLSKPALPELSDELSANVLACTIGKLNLIAAFCNKQSTFNAFMTYIEGMPSDETLLTGDLLHGDMRSDPNHYQNSLKRLLQNHWVDCWKKDNARSDVFCHTNLGNGGQSRPDHVFADSRFARKVINCSYDQSPLVDRLSDHAPMLYKVDV
jgi:endonuclease/exonuclease/phosphatase family metal-dependent hydrolase